MTLRFDHLRVRLVAEDDLDLSELEEAFPTIAIERAEVASGIVVDDYAWRGAFDLRTLDERVERAAADALITIRGSDVVRVASEVLTRYQRLIHRRNSSSTGKLFDEILQVHEGLHAPSTEMAKADLEHALDAWQWTMRLDPEVALPLQLAALFHDLERLESEPRERIEHRAPVQQIGKDSRSTNGPERVLRLLESAGVTREDAEHVRDILHGEAQRVSDAEMLLLNDADALSFLSLGSSGYVDYFGVAQTRRKVAFMLARLGPRAKRMLDTIRLRPDVERLLHEIAA